MRNPFRKRKKTEEPIAVVEQKTEMTEPAADKLSTAVVPEGPTESDKITEWCRSRTTGGIEKNVRNDIYEAYSVYGTDGESLICRRYHRYPEYERAFDLSDSRALDFTSFNSRLLSELDRGSVSLEDYHRCIMNAKLLADTGADSLYHDSRFSDQELDALEAFCESLENVKEKTYCRSGGTLRCEGESVVGGEKLNIRFRKPLQHDSLNGGIAGVSKTEIAFYDIDDIWIMGVCNRLRDSGAKCVIQLLRSEWSLNGEAVYLISAENIPGISGTTLVAVAEASNFLKFGFYSLNFLNK